MKETIMQVQELPTKEFLAHLRRHPIPEIMDGDCLDALASVEAQYGGTITHGAGLEVRLGEEARYVDYIMNIDEKNIPGIENARPAPMRAAAAPARRRQKNSKPARWRDRRDGRILKRESRKTAFRRFRKKAPALVEGSVLCAFLS